MNVTYFFMFFLLDWVKYFVLVMLGCQKFKKQQLNAIKCSFFSYWAENPNIHHCFHQISNLFQNHNFLQLFLHFCIHCFLGTLLNIKMCKNFAIIYKELRKTCNYSKQNFKATKSWNIWKSNFYIFVCSSISFQGRTMYCNSIFS